MRSSGFARSISAWRARVLLGSLGLFAVFRLCFGPHAYADSGFWLFHRGGSGDIVEFSTNAFYPWKFEPIFTAVLSHLSWGYEIYLGLLFSFGALGIFELQRWYRRERGFTGESPNDMESASTAALALFGCLLLLFGLDCAIYFFSEGRPFSTSLRYSNCSTS